MNNIKFKKNEKEIYYHMDHIKAYLRKYFPSSSKTLRLEMFSNNDIMILCNILAKNGMIVLINSSYCSLLFVPERLSIKQKDSLKLIGRIIDNEKKFECIISSNKMKILNDIMYLDILNKLGIENDSLKKGI